MERTEEAKDDYRKHEFADKTKEEQQETDRRRKREADEAGANKKWLLCLGRGSNVPPYLRAVGKVPNKNLTQKFVAKWIEEFWDDKAKGIKSRAMPVDEYLMSYLTLKYGATRGKVEWVYNLMFGIRRYNFDPDCQSFLAILNGEIPEVCYYATKKMLVVLLQVLTKADKENHGGRLWNTLERGEFSETVEGQFKLKTDEEKKALRRALLNDQPLPDIRYKELFESEDGIAAKYLETLREQFIQEVQESYENVESSIRKAAMEDAVARQSIRQMRPEQCYSYLSLIKGVWLFENSKMTDEQMLAIIGKMEIV